MSWLAELQTPSDNCEMPEPSKPSNADRKGTRPPASSEAARKRMLAAKQLDTKPELELRSLLENAGLEFEVDSSPIPELRTRADILVRPIRLVVFVDGCFWHGCPIHGTWPKQNAEFWKRKIETNVKRDSDITRRLVEMGWNVLRVWEHDNMEQVSAQILHLASR